MPDAAKLLHVERYLKRQVQAARNLAVPGLQRYYSAGLAQLPAVAHGADRGRLPVGCSTIPFAGGRATRAESAARSRRERCREY